MNDELKPGEYLCFHPPFPPGHFLHNVNLRVAYTRRDDKGELVDIGLTADDPSIIVKRNNETPSC
jgi:hypothetical protein